MRASLELTAHWGSLLRAMRPRHFAGLWTALILGLVLVSVSPVKAEDDTVVLKNGDRLTGEIKYVEAGILYIKTDYISAQFEVDWEAVDRVESKRLFGVVLDDGTTLYGSLTTDASNNARKLVVTSGGSTVVIDLLHVSVIRPRKRTFRDQLLGSVDAGFNYTRGNSQTQYNVAASANYRTARYAFTSNLSSVFSRGTAAGTSRHELGLSYQQEYKRGWLWGGLADFLSSEEQNLKLRTTTGLVFGRILLRHVRSRLVVYSGGVYVNEAYSGQSPNGGGNGLELIEGIKFTSYTFKSSNISAQWQVFPSLSDFGRVRTALDASFRWKLFKDFYWRFGIQDSLDSRPPSGLSKYDVVVSSSLGWTF